MIFNNDLKVESIRSGEVWRSSSDGVRMTHVPTGLTVECCVYLTQNKNFRGAKLMLEDKLNQAKELSS